jgi:diguanylate cyclase (GGDEF)-like protein
LKASTTDRYPLAAFKNTLTMLVIPLLVALVVTVVGFALDHQNRLAYRQEIQLRTENEANLIRSRIYGQIRMNVATTRNLANLVSLGPTIREEDVQRDIDELLLQNPQFISIALAPNYIVRSISPAAIMNGRIGEDLRARMLILQADPRGADNDEPRFYGPVLTANARSAFAIIFPVYVTVNSQRRLWGAVETTIDAAQFYAATGLKAADDGASSEKYPQIRHLLLAIRDLGSGAGTAMVPFLGNKSIFDQNPVQRTIEFPGGKWELSVVPQAGWDAPPPNQLMLRVIIIVAGFIIVTPIFLSALLVGERNRNIVALQARESELLEVSKRLNLALGSSNIGVWELHDDGGVIYWDAQATALHSAGIRPDGERRLDDWFTIIHPEDRAVAEAHIFNATCIGGSHRAQYRVIGDDGTTRCLRSIGAFYDGSKGAQKTIGIVWDVTADAALTDSLRNAKAMSDIKNAELELALDEISAREHELEGLSQKLDLALDSNQSGIWQFTSGVPEVLWDLRMHQLYGLTYKTGQVSDAEWLSCIHPDDRDSCFSFAKQLTKVGESGSVVRRALLPDGSVRFIRSVGKLHETKDGERKVVGIAYDVTEDGLLTAQIEAAKDEAVAKNVELELAKSRIEHNSLHDPLTALANRRKLDLVLEQLSVRVRSEPPEFAILHIDLDRFKYINDTLGHAAGDAMLVHVSKVLSKNSRGSDIVARIGGDEFVIVCPDACDAAAMAQLATTIIEEMRQPIEFEGLTCRCGVSVGIALADGLHIDPRAVLINADIALYRAKNLGRNRHEFFSKKLQAEVINGKQTADAILAGLEKDEFTAWYQPQFCARSRKLTGVEALVRWNHPTRGLLAPDQFLRIAEDINVVQALDKVVLETALKDKMRWAARGIRIPKISVNVSSKRLHDNTLIETITGLHIMPGELSFELVESIFLDESEDVVSQNIERIKALGIDIEIDDFGTGHTSIVSLLKLKPKRLKIDRQLVMPILNSPQERALVSSIIDIARSLGVETVAEGVETMEHAARLQELGCDLLQGYAFARPLSFEAFSETVVGAGWLMTA